MATPRKRWFKVLDEIGSGTTASNHALAFYLRLGAHMSTRWAADGLSTEQSASCVLSKGQLLHLAGCERADRAVRVAREFAGCFEATFEERGDYYWIEWRKFASLQWPDPEGGANQGNDSARGSEFAAELLRRAGVLPASIDPSEWVPRDLVRASIYRRVEQLAGEPLALAEANNLDPLAVDRAARDRWL